MFESLSERLSHSLRSITGKARLTEENIQDTMREVRMALLEADVAEVELLDDALDKEVIRLEEDSVDVGELFLNVCKNCTGSKGALEIVDSGHVCKICFDFP